MKIVGHRDGETFMTNRGRQIRINIYTARLSGARHTLQHMKISDVHIAKPFLMLV